MFAKKDSDWPKLATDTIVTYIDTARAKAVDPIILAAKALVYGTLALIVNLALSVLLAIVFIPMLHIYLGNLSFATEEVWLSYVITGILFVVIGLVLWSKRVKPVGGIEK